MENYMKPELEVIEFEDADIITSSGDFNAGGDGTNPDDVIGWPNN